VNDDEEISRALSAERDWWLRRLLAAERAAWLEGYEAGNRDGYLHGTRQLEAEWRAAVVPVIDRTVRHLDAMGARWTLRGDDRTRETFGQPHPGDRFPARDSAS
jgi:hypothetical protein